MRQETFDCLLFVVYSRIGKEQETEGILRSGNIPFAFFRGV